MFETKVFNIKKEKISYFNKQKNNIFVGKGTKWENPFKDQQQSILKYINHLYDTNLIKNIYELYGKNLGTVSNSNKDELDRPLNNAQVLADILNKCLYSFVAPQLFNTINNQELVNKVFFNKKPIKYYFPEYLLLCYPNIY